jgi:Spy/CpxP family protein refolding chaperone
MTLARFIFALMLLLGVMTIIFTAAMAQMMTTGIGQQAGGTGGAGVLLTDSAGNLLTDSAGNLLTQ